MSSLPKLSPMDLLQVPAPFDDPDFLYEVKFDGFRALASVEDDRCELVPRKGSPCRRTETATSPLLRRPRTAA